MKLRLMRRPLIAFPEKVMHTLTRYGMVSWGNRIIVGVSGGPDSMALLHTLSRLQGEWGGSLVVAHFNHGLRRGEAEAEANFVRQMAQRLDLPYVEEMGEVAAYAKRQKCSLQVAARKLRYQFLHEVLRQQQAEKIAVAHTASDQAETLLITLLRGTARSGLRGILPQRADRIIRPLLAVTREEVEAFLAEAEIPYVLDPTNTKFHYLRNRIRHHLLPLLQKRYNPRVVSRLHTLATILQEEETYLAREAETAYRQALLSATACRVTLALPILQSLPLTVLRRVLREGVYQAGGDRLTSFHLERIAHLVTAGKAEKSWHLPGRIIVQRKTRELVFQREERSSPSAVPQRLRIPGQTFLPWCHLTLCTSVYRREKGETIAFLPGQEVVDYRQTGDTLWVRTWQRGDRFTPLGMQQEKRLARFFIDEKIPREMRDYVPLLTTTRHGGAILYVVGKRIADQVKITEETREILMIKCSSG